MSISVIIPTYNRATFLERAIDSVFRQTRAPDELIIVDDGSVDETRLRVARLEARAPFPIRYLYQENRGAAAARNRGIREASCGLICFLDSDDRFEPEKLSLQSAALQESSCLVSHTRETWYRRGRLLNQKKKHQPRGGVIFADCLKMCVVGMSTVMARKELFDLCGLFDERLPCCEDYDFWLRVSVREEFLLVPHPLTVKEGGRKDQLSVIHRQGMDRYRIMSIISLLDGNTLSEVQRRLAVSELRRKCMIYGNGCRKHGRADEGEFYLRLAARYAGRIDDGPIHQSR
jgi:glycosyltransferase involved in cell wall biosynthesis